MDCETPTDLSVFDLQSYSGSWCLPYRSPEIFVSTLRLASPSTKVDFEYLFLRCTIFGFNCPRMLERFLDQLSPYQQSLLRHFTIDIFGDCFCENNESYRGWITVCAHIPPSLKSMTFHLGPKSRPGTLPRWSRDGSSHIRGRAEIKAVKKVAELVEVLSKRIVRSAPRVQITMRVDCVDGPGRRHLLPVDRDLLNDAIGDVEQ